MLEGTYAHIGEIFDLDIGSPAKIYTLARNLIKRSWFKPEEDIKIEYTGFKPNEKLEPISYCIEIALFRQDLMTRKKNAPRREFKKSKSRIGHPIFFFHYNS